MFISLQARSNADADDFFSNTRISANIHHCQMEGSFGRKPSLISWVVFQGCLVQGKIQQLERLLQLHVLDMAAIVHMFKLQRASVFGEYTEMQLLLYLESHMMDRTAWLDASWNTDRQVSSPKLGYRPCVAQWLERPLGVRDAGVRSPTASHQRRKNWEVCASQLGAWH